MTNAINALSTATAEVETETTVKRGPGRPRLFSDNERVQRARLATRRSQAKRQNQTNDSLDAIQRLLSSINVGRLNADGKQALSDANGLLEGLLEKFPQVTVEAE